VEIGKAQIGNSGSREAFMDSNKSDRRRFLKQTAALAGVAAGAGLLTAKGQTTQDKHVYSEPPRRGARYSIDHMTHYTPLQDYAGIITPSRLHFMQQHSSEFPEIDVDEHRLTIHGMVDRPLSFTMEELKRLPSVSRVHFLECQGNSSSTIHATRADPNMGLPVQYIWGMTSCSEWTGVPLSVLLNEAGVQKEATLASLITPFRWQRPWTTFSWPMARMAIRCALSRGTRSG
jgi:sulfane dehydrogenase subunit SoxC